MEKKSGMISNPYLDEPDIMKRDGRLFMNKNPVLITREISVYAERKGLFRFHLTTLSPLNPDNRPDVFEANVLRTFERGEKEAFQLEQQGKTVFRYMAPLFVERECLDCHVRQGYRNIRVRGDSSVTFDVKDIKRYRTRIPLSSLPLAASAS